MTKEDVKLIASIAWKGAANAHRMYPDNKHTFAEYWDGAESQFSDFCEEDSGMSENPNTPFETAARPLMKYMAETKHPHTQVVVESNRAYLLECVPGFNYHTDEFLKD